MRKEIFGIATLSVISFIRIEAFGAEERLSWIAEDPEIWMRMFTPYNLTKGNKSNKILPWVFHDNEETKVIELKCLKIGYNASNNPNDDEIARWSYWI